MVSSRATERSIKQVKLWHQLAMKYLGGKCSMCNGKESLQIHHIDGDPDNSDDSNLMLLCLTHHWFTHSQRGETS